MDQEGNSGLVLARGQGGEVADVACGHDNRLIGVNGVGIFGGLIQGLSEKTEGNTPLSLVFGQDSNPTDTRAKRYLRGFFAKPPKVRKISDHIRKPLQWVSKKS